MVEEIRHCSDCIDGLKTGWGKCGSFDRKTATPKYSMDIAPETPICSFFKHIPEPKKVNLLQPINFEGIIGHAELKQEILYSIIAKLKDNAASKAYLKSIDDHATTGILIYGLPGLGKSDILRMVGESVKGHPDIDCEYMSCSDFQGNVGTNASKIDEIFDRARNTKKKVCIMLIDEIDSVMMKKKGHLNVAERTNAMQSNMDGVNDSSKIVVIATTNRINGMEHASISRFTLITLKLPSREERIEFVKRFLNPIPFESPLLIEKIAEITDGFTGRMFRDIGKKLDRIRIITDKPITAMELTNQLMTYVSVASRNRNTTNDDENPTEPTNDHVNCSNASYIEENTSYKRPFTNLDSDIPEISKTPLTELTTNILKFQEEQYQQSVNSSNIVDFALKFVQVYRPKWTISNESGEYTPSAIKGIASKIFKVTP
jgi:AAA+ superfamily predicted ATPase